MDEHGTTSFAMYWEDGSAVWRHFGVTGQPTALLLEPDGTEIKRWVGRLDPDDVLAALDSA